MVSTLNCRGQLVDISQPKVMGILNVTPDSFFDGGSIADSKDMTERVAQMLSDGADFIDVGGYSSRPGAKFVSEAEELSRIVPAIKFISLNFPDVIISVDTFRSKVAEACIESGAAMINDISAGALDDKMMMTVAKHGVPYIMMHMRGDVQTTHEITKYDDVVGDIIKYFAEKIALARSFGISDLIIDPGFGFSKTMEQNFLTLQKLEQFSIIDLPILVGMSRKSMVCKTLNVKPTNALNGTTFLNTAALLKGAKILRVHDVKEAKECVKLYESLHQAQ